MTVTAFDQQVLDVARAHGTAVAAEWAHLSRSQVVDLRKRHDGYSRGRGHPSTAEIAAMAPRHSCDCRRCDDWRAELDIERRRLAATMTDLIGTPDEWRIAAACLGLDRDLFFPSTGQSTREAKAVCARCPVRQPCLDEALATQGVGQEVGILGGTSGRERRRMRAGQVAS